MKKIQENLYLGDMYSAPKNSDLVISCAEETYQQVKFNREKLIDNDFYFYTDEKHVYFNFADYPNYDEINIQYVQTVIDIIKKALLESKKVYVHCVYGVNRSASIVFMYLVQNQIIKGESYIEAQKTFWKIYPYHSPNPGWKKFLSNNYPFNF